MIEYYKNFSLEPIVYTNQFGQKHIEEWQDVVNYEGLYKVSNLGRVLSLNKKGMVVKNEIGKILKQQFDYKGYLVVGISKNDKIKTMKVHRLVAINFIPNPLNLPEVNHNSKTGDKTDNREWMLLWSTTKDNCIHASKNGLRTALKGEKHNKAKLTEAKVLEIRKKYKYNVCSYRMLSEEYGVVKSVIAGIVSRKIWNHI